MNSSGPAGVLDSVRTRLVIVAVFLAACTAAPTATEDRATAAPSVSSAPESAIDLLECERGPSEVGGAGEGLAAEAPGGDTPDEALAAFLASSSFVIPRTGYELIATTGDRHAYGYRADGEVKVVLVISERFGELVGARFTADELRTCPEAEFGADAEFNDERRVWAHETTGLTLADIAGSAHCGWQTARMLHVPEADGSLGKQYIRDPFGVFAGIPLLDTYAEDVELPDDATFSGYRSRDDQELWFTDADRAAYVVTPDGIERWPRAEEPIGCM